MEAFLVIGYLVWAMLNAIVASERGRSVAGCLALSFVISPFFVYLYLVAVPMKARQEVGHD